MFTCILCNQKLLTIDYEIEQKFHHYEYENTCLEWEFIEIENGFHLNCYPDGIIHKNLDILLKMKELTSDSQISSFNYLLV